MHVPQHGRRYKVVRYMEEATRSACYMEEITALCMLNVGFGLVGGCDSDCVYSALSGAVAHFLAAPEKLLFLKNTVAHSIFCSG